MRVFPIWLVVYMAGLLALTSTVTSASAQTTPASPSKFSEPLTLPRFLQQVEASFPKLIGAEFERQSVTSKRIAKEGAFNPQISLSTESLRYNSASARGKASTNNETELGIEVATPYGIKLAAGRLFNAGTVKSPDSSTGSGGTYFFYLKAPLQRGAGANEKSTLLEQARLGEPIATANLSLIRQSVLLEAAQIYWYWVGTGRKREIATQLLTVAEFRAKGIACEIEEKQRPAIDGIEAQAEVERRRVSQIKSERDVESATLKLRKYLWEEGISPSPDLPVLPTPPTFVAPELKTLLQRATERRPERVMLSLQQQSVLLDAKLAKNDLKPNIDFIFSPGRDTGNKGIGSTLKAGISASIPLYQQEARGRLAEAEQKSQKWEQELRLVERGIEIDVRDGMSAVTRSYERYSAAKLAYEQNLLLEKGEITRFKEGDSTLFLVNQRERATAESLSVLVDIQVGLEQAQASLKAATMDL
jgi:outer membrane protein